MLIARNPGDPRVAARNARFAAAPTLPSEQGRTLPADLALGAWDNEGGAAAARSGDWRAGLKTETRLPGPAARPKRR